MKLTINKKAKELSLPIENKKFKERFDKVLKAVEGKGIEVTELEKMLSKVFWDLRHKIVNRILTSLFPRGV